MADQKRLLDAIIDASDALLVRVSIHRHPAVAPYQEALDRAIGEARAAGYGTLCQPEAQEALPLPLGHEFKVPSAKRDTCAAWIMKYGGVFGYCGQPEAVHRAEKEGGER